ILDIGCGRGGTVDVIAQYFETQKIVGIDLSRDAIAFCVNKHRYKHVYFLEGDAESLAFGDNAFDIVTNIESSHIYPDMLAFYREVFRVLKPGGYFLYADLLPADQVSGYLTALQAMSLILETDRDVTANVLLSCDEIAKRNFAAFGSASNDRELMHNFLA